MHSSEVMTLTSDSIALYRDSLCARGRSAQTAKSYASDLKMFMLDMATVTIQAENFDPMARAWLQEWRGKLNPKTTTRRMTSLKSFAKFAGWGEVLDDYAAPTGGSPKPHPLPGGIEDVRRMAGVARNENERALVAFCGLVGTRVSEALKVRPYDIDLDEMELRVFGKGEKIRYVPLSEEAFQLIQRAMLAAGLKGPGTTLITIEDRYARAVVTRMGERAGIRRRVSSHDLRATFATEVFNRTKNIRVVQDLLGHEDVSTTQLYVGVSNEEMRNSVIF